MKNMKDKDFLAWMYARLVHVYNEDSNVDYMRRFKAIINATDINTNISKTLDKQKQDLEIVKIQNMSHMDMCKLWRKAPSGHPYFDMTLSYFKVFEDHLMGHFGGFTPEISKEIGWEKT